MTNPNLPAWLQNLPPAKLTDTLASNLGGGAPPYVSIMGNRFMLVDEAGAEEPVTTVDAKTGIPYLDCCIIDAGDHPSKIYYAKPFDPNAQTWSPPDCWSDNGVAPSINASTPQARSCVPDPTGTHGCKLAVWGSATSKVSGKGVPACSKYQKLALAIPGDDIVFLLRVPPNSLDNLRAYNLKFKGQPVGVNGVITRVSFEQGGIGTLTFEAVNYVDEATCKFAIGVLAKKGTDVLVGRGDLPHPGVAALPAGQQETVRPLPAPEVASAPVVASTNLIPAPTQPSPSVGAAPSNGAGQPSGRTRRRRQMAEAAPAAAPVQAPFPTPQASFGIAPGVAPNPELQSALDDIFKK